MEATPPFSETVAAGVRAGDPDALAACYRALVGPLTAWLRAQVRDDRLAEDLATEAFLKLVRNCRSIEGNALQIRSWLYTVARRNILDWRRARDRRPDEQLTDVLPDHQSSEAGPAEWTLHSEDNRRVAAALDQLAPAQAEVLTLRFLVGMSAPEVAAVLDTTEGAVRALQHRGVARLTRLIEEDAVPISRPQAPQRLPGIIAAAIRVTP